MHTHVDILSGYYGLECDAVIIRSVHVCVRCCDWNKTIYRHICSDHSERRMPTLHNARSPMRQMTSTMTKRQF